MVQSFPQKVKTSLNHHYESAEVLLKIYNIASIVCLVVDIIAALVMLVLAGKQEYPLAYLSQALVVTIYFYTDVFLFFYMGKLFMEMPESL